MNRRENYEVLNMQGIKSLVAAPLEIGGKLSGYIGVDNPPVDKIKNISSTICRPSLFPGN